MTKISEAEEEYTTKVCETYLGIPASYCKDEFDRLIENMKAGIMAVKGSSLREPSSRRGAVSEFFNEEFTFREGRNWESIAQEIADELGIHYDEATEMLEPLAPEIADKRIQGLKEALEECTKYREGETIERCTFDKAQKYSSDVLDELKAAADRIIAREK